MFFVNIIGDIIIVICIVLYLDFLFIFEVIEIRVFNFNKIIIKLYIIWFNFLIFFVLIIDEVL